ncbi:MAG: response regulator [Nitrospinae bacterium]|nr:response regulator [Nitrospinota bacterium]
MKSRILVIDDEDSIRFAFKEILNYGGYEVDTAGEYNEALSLISEKEFDLIFTDLNLNDRSGIDILRQVREKKLDCPVVIITGSPSSYTAVEAFQLGVFDYISKPIEAEKILHIAAMALNK